LPIALLAPHSDISNCRTVWCAGKFIGLAVLWASIVFFSISSRYCAHYSAALCRLCWFGCAWRMKYSRYSDCGFSWLSGREGVGEIHYVMLYWVL
jgi:hypothetical protein